MADTRKNVPTAGGHSRDMDRTALEMIRIPFPNEWDTSQLDEHRREYLEARLSFEQIAEQVCAKLDVIRVRIKGYETPAHGEPKHARQIIFTARTSKQACDLLYNAPDGLRGRYWQSPDHGFLATRHLIGSLTSALLSYAEHNPPVATGGAADMNSEDIRCSLAAPSAKLWPRERGDDETLLLIEHNLLVSRWYENEQHAHINHGMWRRTPTSGELEIKGGIVDIDCIEYVPNGKRDRSYQIHRFGFT